jgi:exopolysaccharide biosynthesis polyprenyl glycosylphosphotransferase
LPPTTKKLEFVAEPSALDAREQRGVPARNPAVGDGLRLATFIGDGLIFLAVQVAAFWLRLQTRVFDWILPESAFITANPAEAFTNYFDHFILGTILFLVIGASFRIYSRNAYLRPRFVLGDLFKACVAWTLGYLLFSLFFKIEPSVSRAFVVLAGALGFLVLAGWRVAFNRWIQKLGLLFHVQDRLLVIGWTKDTETLWRRARKGDFRELVVTGAVPVNGSSFVLQPPKDLPITGSLADLDRILALRGHDAVLLADTDIPPAVLSQVVQTCHREMVRFMAIPAFFEVLVSGLHLESIRGVPVLSLGQLPLDSLPNRLMKRTLDLVGGTVGLILSAPLIAVFAAMVLRESRGPVFYSQVRVGRNGKPFRIHKIRSMRVDAEQDEGPQWAKEGDGRRLRVGSFMRAWNIDELPQFWNVLKGEMSLVGPRPERPEFIKDFKHSVTYYNVRHTVKPGVTGWAAVNGWRGNTDLNERIRFDLDYIERWSLLFDCYIMLLTFARNKNAY